MTFRMSGAGSRSVACSDLANRGKARSPERHRGLKISILLALAYTCTCATGPEPRPVPAYELLCHDDADCEIVTTDVGEACCYSNTEPYAISRAAAERHRVRTKIKCAQARCTAECQEIMVTRSEDWVAVCSGHACKRRSTKFFPSPEPSCL